MTSKEDIMKTLEEVAREQKDVTDEVLAKLNFIAEKLISILEEHGLTDYIYNFDYLGYGFRYKGSSYGEWLHLCALSQSYSKILPTLTTDIARTFYYNNDLNYPTQYMYRSEVLGLCEVLPEFVQNMISKIQNLSDREREFLEKFKMLE